MPDLKTLCKRFPNGATIVCILFLPFLAFYWLLPFFGTLIIGNDYGVFSLQSQLELQFSLEHGSFPLYSPGFAGGRSAAALTQGQLFHPVSHLSRMMPGYWDGLALEWNTFFRLVQLGFAQLAIFFLLMRLKLSWIICFALSFITTYNLRMLDMFRYGAALESYTGYLYLFVAIGFHFLKPGRITGPLIMAAMYLMICGGHPQMAYYGVLGIVILTLVTPFAFRAINSELKELRPKISWFYLTVGAWSLAGVFMASAYVIPFYFEFVNDAGVRVGQSYEWSIVSSDNWGGALGSIFEPLRSDVHSAFGSSSIVVYVALTPLLWLARSRSPIIILVLWAGVVLVVFCSLGNATPVNYFFWKYFPFAQSFRLSGRINMILPPVLLLILAWHFRPMLQSENTFQGYKAFAQPTIITNILAVLCFAIFHWYFSDKLPDPARYSPARIHESVYPVWLDRVTVSLGFITLLFAACFQFFASTRSNGIVTTIGILLSVAVVLQGALQMRYGTWVVEKSPVWTLVEMSEQKNTSISFGGVPGYGVESSSVTDQMRRSFLDPRLATFYQKYLVASDQDDAYSLMATERTPDTVVVEKEAEKRLATRSTGLDRVELIYSSFNKLTFFVDAFAAGHFVLSYPFSGRWKGFIDGVPAETKRANGNLISLHLEAGKQLVTFRYSSVFSLVGVIVSCLSLAIAVCIYTTTLKTARNRRILSAVAVTASTSLFVIWHASLYEGETFNTIYRWDSSEFPDVRNVSYGRPTRMSSVWSSHTPYLYHSGRAVDGDRERDGFVTSEDDLASWWEVDLGLDRTIHEVVIYPAPSEHLISPINLLVSSDGRNYLFIRSFETSTQSESYRIAFPERLARFIRLTSGRSGPISVREVEVYRPN